MQENSHSFLAEELLSPNANKVDSGRLQMFSSHVNQLLILEKPDVPKVFTNFENQTGALTGRGIRVLEEDYEVLKIFEISEYRKYLVIKLVESGKLHILEYRTANLLTENFGYTDTLNPAIKEGSTHTKDEFIHRNNMYDDDKNLRYGRNLKTLFMPFRGKTFEDSIVISRSTSEALAHTRVSKFDISINNNDVLVRGGIPKVGSVIEDGILCVRRRLKKDSMLETLRDREIEKIHSDDAIFYSPVGSIVTDIEVYPNDSEELEKQYNSHYKEIFDSTCEVLSSMIHYVEESKLVLTEDADYIINRSKDYIDPELQYSIEGKRYDGMFIRVTTIDSVPAKEGSKLTGRMGSKGVISLILEDKEMPGGADIIVNSLGVVGRLNLSQCYEHELNFIADAIRDRNKTAASFKKELTKFYSMVSPTMLEYIKSLPAKESNAVFKEMYDTGNIFIHQPPFFGNTDFNDLVEVYKEFKVDKIKVDGIAEPESTFCAHPPI